MGTPYIIDEYTTVARIEGVGCTYQIGRNMADGTCFVHVESGPVSRTVLTEATWLAAMQYVANDVEIDVCSNADIENSAVLTITPNKVCK